MLQYKHCFASRTDSLQLTQYRKCPHSLGAYYGESYKHMRHLFLISTPFFIIYAFGAVDGFSITVR